MLHKLWLARNKQHMRERKLAQSLDKAAKAAQQQHQAEHGDRKARIDEWLATQELPRALPALKPLLRAPPSVGDVSAAGSLRKEMQREMDFKSSRDSQQTRGTALAMKIGALPHSQWHLQRGGSFTMGNSLSTRGSLETSSQSPNSPAVRPALPPSLPAMPLHLPPLKK